jgi:hypothetical protein
MKTIVIAPLVHELGEPYFSYPKRGALRINAELKLRRIWKGPLEGSRVMTLLKVKLLLRAHFGWG